MASRTAFLVLTMAVLALVQSIEAWLPPFFPGYNPGYIPGFNAYVPELPFVPGMPGAPPPYYDDKGVNDPSSATSSHSRTEPLEDRSHCSDQSSMSPPSPPTPLFGSSLGALNPVNWLFRKWPITWNIPPANTQFYNTGNGNGWSKTWSWNF